MRRRDVLALLAALAGSSALAEEPDAELPVVGFFRSTPAAPFADIVAAFREGLASEGFVEGKSVAIEFRWADGKLDRLPALAADLVQRRVSVIVGNSLAVEAAKAATADIPIVFVAADDPVRSGLVASLGRPGGNVTGVTFFGGGQLGPKRLDLIRALAPDSGTIAVLRDSGYTPSEGEVPGLEAAARALNRRLVIVQTTGDGDLERAFAEISGSGARALLVSGSPFYTSRHRRLVALAAAAGIPAIYDQRSFVEAGGLISYGASFTDAYRQAGVYAGRILKGKKPGDLPVLRPTAFELVLNMKTAASLGISVPPTLLAQADEVIE